MKDVKKRPDFVLVMGTSLAIPSVRRLVKEFAKAAHSFKKGKGTLMARFTLVVLVNKTQLALGDLEDVFDFKLYLETDEFVQSIEHEWNTLDGISAVKQESLEKQELPCTPKRKLQPSLFLTPDSQSKKTKKFTNI
jgi:hypothetical protein